MNTKVTHHSKSSKTATYAILYDASDLTVAKTTKYKKRHAKKLRGKLL